MATDKSRKRVCIIGAGPSGLAVLRAFRSEESKLKEGEAMPELVCYEKQSDWGGLWNYSWRTGLDENGEKVHGSMYRYLWSNGPKECLEFADYSFEKHFGKAIPSYPPRPVLFDYIKGRVEKCDVRKFVRFNTAVHRCDYDEKSGKFTVVAQDYGKKETIKEEFDNVVVCVGHFSTPNVPYFPGFESFKGRVLHAHDFRDAVEFKGKRVLIVGASYSAEDIGSQCFKYGAKEIICSYRTAPMPYKWPKEFKTVPLLTKVTGHTAHFKDGSSHEIDAVILCTGYLHSFPFLSDKNLRLETANRLWPLGLYRGIVWEKNPKLFYIGMQDQWYTFNMFDAQAWLARDFILGRQKVPSLDDMQKNSAEWRNKEEKADTAKKQILYQGAYVKDLIKDTNYPTFDVDKVNEVFLHWKHDKMDSIMGYRDVSYPSVLTGTPSPKHHTKWIDALDDSLECYLGAPEKANL